MIFRNSKNEHGFFDLCMDLRCIESISLNLEKVYWIVSMWIIYKDFFSIFFKWHG